MESRKERLGRLMEKNRRKSGMSKTDVAKETGYYVKTISNWETGYTAPDMDQLLAYCEAIGCNVAAITLPYQHPEIELITSTADEEEIDEAFDLVVDELSPLAKKQLFFLFSGVNGSDPTAMLQLVMAHAQCQIFFRFSVAQIVAANYDFSVAQGKLSCPQEVQPVTGILKRAIQRGYDAALDGRTGYTPGGEQHAKAEKTAVYLSSEKRVISKENQK